MSYFYLKVWQGYCVSNIDFVLISRKMIQIDICSSVNMGTTVTRKRIKWICLASDEKSETLHE